MDAQKQCASIILIQCIHESGWIFVSNPNGFMDVARMHFHYRIDGNLLINGSGDL